MKPEPGYSIGSTSIDWTAWLKNVGSQSFHFYDGEKNMRRIFVSVLRYCCIVALLSASVAVRAEERRVRPQRPSVGEEVSLPEQGLKFRTFKRCEQTPVPLCDEFYAPEDVKHEHKIVPSPAYWTYMQTVARYASGDGLNIRVYAPRYVPCVKLPAHLPEEQFLKWSELAENAVEKEKFDAAAWLDHATGMTWRETDDLKPKPNKNIERSLYSASGSDGDCYALCLFPKDAPERRMVIEWSLPGYASADRKQALRILENVIANTSFFPPKENTKGAKKLRAKSAVAAGKGKTGTDQYRRSRERVIENLKNLPDWWYLETEHFIIVSNIRKRKNISYFKEEADKVFSAYLKVMPPLVEITNVCVIRVFDDKKEYRAYTGQEEWSAGCWMPSKQELVFYLEDDSSRGEQAYQRTIVLHHEMFHQYLSHAAGGAQAHVWFNEGSAKFFEKIVCRQKGRYSLALDKKYVEVARNAASGPYSDVRKLLALSYEDFYEDYKNTYDAAFALMIFLYKGAPLLRDAASREKYTAIPFRYYRSLAEMRDPAKAQEAAWDGIDMKKFNHDYADFWEGKSKFGRAAKADEIVPMTEQRLPESERPASAESKKDQ